MKVRTTFFGAAAVAVMLAHAGCSSGPGDLGAVRVEPDLPHSSPRAVGPVPVVIARQRPFRIQTPRPASLQGEPRRLPPVDGLARAGDTLPEVRGMLASYLGAFNRHDVAAVAAHWADDAENVDLESGAVTAGREAVRDVFATLFTEDPAASIDIDVQAIRPVRADVAVVDGTSTLDFGDGARAGSRFSAVVVKERGRWLLQSVRETPCPDAASASRPLEQLAWLVGSWEDVGPGVTASSRCFWSAGRAFLIRTHAVAADAAEPRPESGDAAIPGLLPAADVAGREVTEIIGWDPESGAVRSWAFTSDGRFAEGFWQRDGDAWKVRMEGRGADAGRSCEATLVRVGADEVSVRGASDGLAAALAPVCDFVRTAR